mmetsp:Transcript_21840/g.54625  ORF Transcript_21840/g.54625 Transcript_21840/m.54625 type:complete len:162 (+) Transcript_21840:189-674(+)
MLSAPSASELREERLGLGQYLVSIQRVRRRRCSAQGSSRQTAWLNIIILTFIILCPLYPAVGSSHLLHKLVFLKIFSVALFVFQCLIQPGSGMSAWNLRAMPCDALHLPCLSPPLEIDEVGRCEQRVVFLFGCARMVHVVYLFPVQVTLQTFLQVGCRKVL